MISGQLIGSNKAYHLSNHIYGLDYIQFSVTRECPRTPSAMAVTGLSWLGALASTDYISNGFRCLPCAQCAATCDTNGVTESCQFPLQLTTDKFCVPCATGTYFAGSNQCVACPGEYATSCTSSGDDATCVSGTSLQDDESCGCASGSLQNGVCAPCTDTGVQTSTDPGLPLTCFPGYHMSVGYFQTGPGAARCCAAGFFNLDDGFVNSTASLT